MPEFNGAAFHGLQKLDVINNLTSTDSDKPLSAAQGKALNDNKVNKEDVINSLTSTSTNPISSKGVYDAFTGYIKASTYTGTTNADGYLVTDIPQSTNVLNASLSGYGIAPLRFNNLWYFLVLDPTGGTVKPKANLNITLSYVYV